MYCMSVLTMFRIHVPMDTFLIFRDLHCWNFAQRRFLFTMTLMKDRWGHWRCCEQHTPLVQCYSRNSNRQGWTLNESLAHLELWAHS